MIRYRLSDFLNKHKALQFSFLVIILTLVLGYVVMLDLDVFNLVKTASYNYELIEDDTDLVELEDFELSNTTLVVGDKEYKDITVCFYGIVTDDTTTYFNEGNNTLLRSLPNGFWASFFISSNTFIVLISVIFITILLCVIRKSERLKLSLVNKYVCIFSIVFTVCFIINMFLIMLVLY